MNKSIESILVVAAHPDDEVLGCGGTIARLSRAGIPVSVLFTADGVTSRDATSDEMSCELELRRKAARRACNILGVTRITFLDNPDNMLDTVPLLGLAKQIESEILEVKPTHILTHHAGDTNIDHRRTLDACVVCCRPQRDNHNISIFTFEVASSTEWQIPSNHSSFVPNLYIDISDYLDVKLKALECYRYELRDWPHPRSLKAIGHLAKWRGATVGVDSAEAYVIGRMIL